MAAVRSDKATFSVFKLQTLSKAFTSDIEHLGNRGTYTDTVIHQQQQHHDASSNDNNNSISIYSSIFSACIADSALLSGTDVSSPISSLLDAVRRREGGPVADVNSLGNARLEYSMPQDATSAQDSLEKLLDLRRGLAYLLSTNQAAELITCEDGGCVTKDSLLQPDITIKLGEDKHKGDSSTAATLENKPKNSTRRTATTPTRGSGSPARAQAASVATKGKTALPKQAPMKGRVSLTSSAKPTADAGSVGVETSRAKHTAVATEESATAVTTAGTVGSPLRSTFKVKSCERKNRDARRKKKKENKL